MVNVISLTILSDVQDIQLSLVIFALREDGKYIGTLEAVQIIDGLVDAIKNDKKGPIDLK